MKKHIKKITIISGILIILSLSTVWAASTVFNNIDGYIDEAIEGSLELEVDKKNEVLALNSLNEANLNAETTVVYGSNPASVMRLINTKYIVPFTLQTSYDRVVMNTKDDEQQIAYDVYLACENILFYEKKMEIEKELCDIQKEKLEIAKEQYEEQIISEIAYLTETHNDQVKMRSYNSTVNTVEENKRKLNILLGNEVDADIRVEGTFAQEEAIEIDLNEFIENRLLVDTYLYNYTREIEKYEMQMSYTIEYYDADSDTYLETEYRVDYNKLKKMERENYTQLSLRTKYYTLLDNYDYIDITLLSLEIAEMKYEEALFQYSKGVNTQSNVFYSKESLLSAKSAYYNAIFNANVKTAEFTYLYIE